MDSTLLALPVSITSTVVTTFLSHRSSLRILFSAHKEQFWWFPHMWRHLQPHKFDNQSVLMTEMYKNKVFAEVKKVPGQKAGPRSGASQSDGSCFVVGV